MHPPLRMNSDGMMALQSCLKEVKSWRELDFLSLNENQTEVIVSGKSDLLLRVDTVLGWLSSYNHSFVRNLGVMPDTAFKLDKQISLSTIYI